MVCQIVDAFYSRWLRLQRRFSGVDWLGFAGHGDVFPRLPLACCYPRTRRHHPSRPSLHLHPSPLLRCLFGPPCDPRYLVHRCRHRPALCRCSTKTGPHLVLPVLTPHPPLSCQRQTPLNSSPFGTVTATQQLPPSASSLRRLPPEGKCENQPTHPTGRSGGLVGIPVKLLATRSRIQFSAFYFFSRSYLVVESDKS